MDSYCDQQRCLETGVKVHKLAGRGYINACEKHSRFPEDFLKPGVFWISETDEIESDT